MKNFRMLISALLVVTLFANFSFSSIAIDTKIDSEDTNEIANIVLNDFGRMFDHMTTESAMYNIEENDLSDFEILKPLSFYDLGNPNEVDSQTTVQHFPIVDKNENICLIFSVISDGENHSKSIGKDFAPLLDTARKSSPSPIILAQEGLTLYALGKSTAFKQQGKTVSELDSSSYKELLLKCGSHETISTYDFSESEEYSQIAKLSYETYSENKSSTLDTVTIGQRYLQSYPVTNQIIEGEQRRVCWAATIASIAWYEDPQSWCFLTAKQVADYMNIEYDTGGTVFNAKAALQHYLGSPYEPTIILNTLTLPEIQTVINNDDPAYMHCIYNSGFLSNTYHVVALTGYKFLGTETAIQIMDPAYEELRYCELNQNGDWTFPFGAKTYTWLHTVRLLYES